MEDFLDDGVAIDREIEGQTHPRVREETVTAARVEGVLGPPIQVEAAVELLRAAHDLHGGIAREDGGVERGHGVHETDLARAQRGDPRPRFGNDLKAQPSELRLQAPVGGVSLEPHGVLAPPFHQLPGARSDRAVVDGLDPVLDRVVLGHEGLPANEIPEGGGGLARVNADGEVVDLFPPRHEREGLLEGRAGGHLLDAPSIEIAPEHAVEVEEHGVGVERLAVVELHAPAQAELPRRVAHRLPGQGQPGHGLAVRVDVDEALEDLADVGRADRAHADPRVHVGGVVGHRHHQLGLGIGRLSVGRGGHGQDDERDDQSHRDGYYTRSIP